MLHKVVGDRLGVQEAVRKAACMRGLQKNVEVRRWEAAFKDYVLRWALVHNSTRFLI